MMQQTSLCLLVSCLIAVVNAQAQIRVERITPPVLQQGKTTRINVAGSGLKYTSGIWSTLPAELLKTKVIERHPDHAVVDVTTSNDAPVGIHGLRVATDDGLSNVHLFLIDDLPLRTPVKGNIELPAVIAGTFREGDVDRYTFDVTAGELLSFEAVANRLGKDADSLITIRDAAGRFILERDNSPGLMFDCRFEHRFKEAGKYTIEIRDARYEGGHAYALRVGRFPACATALPLAVRPGRNEVTLHGMVDEKAVVDVPATARPGYAQYPVKTGRSSYDGTTWLPFFVQPDGTNNVISLVDTSAMRQAVQPAVTLAFNFSPLRVNPILSLDALITSPRFQPTKATMPGTISGFIAKPGERAIFLLDLPKGQNVTIRGDAATLNSPVDLELALTDRFGKERRKATDVRGQQATEFTATTAGIHALSARDVLRDSGPGHTFLIHLNDKQPLPVLTAEVEGLSIPQGSDQPIPISVIRAVPSGPIKLRLEGNPPGLTLTPDEIGEKDTAIVCRLSTTKDAALGLQSLQIIGECTAGTMVVRTQPLIDKQIVNIDQILYGMREDQRRLPFALNDQLALQVTSPSPFTMEIAEPTITLTRYGQVPIPIVLTRVADFTGPITFTAKGGQLADKANGRTRVYADFPEAAADQPRVDGIVYSKILSNLAKARIEVTGTGEHQGRKVSLTRTFELNLTSAFSITADPPKLALLPGESGKATLKVERLSGFTGEVTVRFTASPGIEMPETVTIPAGQQSVEFSAAIVPGAMARKQNITWNAIGTVAGYEELVRGSFEIEIKKK